MGAWLLCTTKYPLEALVITPHLLQLNASLMTPGQPFTPANFLIMALLTHRNRVYPLRSDSSSIAIAVACLRPLSGENQDLAGWRSFWLCLQTILCSPCSYANHPLAGLSSVTKLVFSFHCFLRPPRSQVHPAPPAMSKFQKRMSYRRGSSHEQTRRQATSSMTDSSTSGPDLRSNRYPATCSRRGRGRGLQILVPSFFHSMTNAARLRFPCNHGSSTFMATVTIELSDLNSSHGASSLRATSNRLVVDNPGPIQENLDQSKASGSGKGKASQSMEDLASSSDDNDDYKYGCHITEDSPDPSPDA